jgi:hypothetical protein
MNDMQGDDDSMSVMAILSTERGWRYRGQLLDPDSFIGRLDSAGWNLWARSSAFMVAVDIVKHS